MTTETKFTPGPWEALARPHDLPAVVNSDRTAVIAERIYNGNAALIAAAPDLYAALEEIIDLQPDDDGDRIIPAGFLDAARAALAKARGEA